MLRHSIRASMAVLALFLQSWAWEIVPVDPAASILASGGDILTENAQSPVYWYLSGLFKKSADNGVSWSNVNWSDGMLAGIYTVQLSEESDLLLVGNSSINTSMPFLGFSTDGGASWAKLEIDSLISAFGDISQSEGNLLLAGFDSTNGSDWIGTLPHHLVVAKSVDGGHVWTITLIDDSVAYIAPSLYKMGPDLYYLVFARGTAFNATYETYKSTDGGQSWEKDTEVSMRPQGGSKVKVLSPSFYYCADALGAAWFKSTDSGKTWTVDSVFSSFENSDLFISDISFVNELHGMAIGNYGAIMTTVDGGQNWNVDTLSRIPLLKTGQQTEKVFIVDSTHFWISGKKGLLWKQGYSGSDAVGNGIRTATRMQTLRVNGGALYIDKSFIGGTLRVITPAGKLVRSLRADYEKMSLSSMLLPQGFYFLTVEKKGRKAGTYQRF